MKKEGVVKKSIEEFNKYRSPEAHATLVKIDEKGFVVRFEGSFCYTCGFYEYFEDLRIIAEERGLKTRIERIEEGEGSSLVVFRFS